MSRTMTTVHLYHGAIAKYKATSMSLRFLRFPGSNLLVENVERGKDSKTAVGQRLLEIHAQHQTPVLSYTVALPLASMTCTMWC